MSYHRVSFPPKLQPILLLQVTVKRVMTITPKSMKGMERTPLRSQKGDGDGGGGEEEEEEEDGEGEENKGEDKNKDKGRGHGEDQASTRAPEFFKQKKYKNTL
jgi:hypothetical protein